MPELPNTQLLYAENFRLECYRVEGFGDIPVVDGWLQLSLAAQYIPNLTEQESCLQTLLQLAQQGKADGHIRYWHFLRKPPGLKLRWHITSVTAIPWLVQHIAPMPWAWLGPIEADSVFGQRELLQGHYPDTYGLVLDMAASTAANAPRAAHPQNLQAWVELTRDFILTAIPDPWLAWEALGRFGQLRSQPLGKPNAAHSTYCPSPLLQLWQLTAPTLRQHNATEKPVLTGTLMLLNYIFNIWGIDATTQAAILTQARQQLRPELAGEDVP